MSARTRSGVGENLDRREASHRKRISRFVALWTLAVVATSSAFILYLALRSRAVELGYRLGRARARQAQLRETRRVLQVEAVSYRMPERIEALARGVLRMEEPPPQRIFVMGGAIEPTEAPSANAKKLESAPSASAAMPSAASLPSGALPAAVAPNPGGAP
jgi:cell division protein FtsL